MMPCVAAAALQVDEMAPDFVLRSLDDGNLRLSEFRSEVVVLNFWSVWCSNCRDAASALEEFYQQYESAGLQVLSVGVTGN